MKVSDFLINSLIRTACDRLWSVFFQMPDGISPLQGIPLIHSHDVMNLGYFYMQGMKKARRSWNTDHEIIQALRGRKVWALSEILALFVLMFLYKFDAAVPVI